MSTGVSLRVGRTQLLAALDQLLSVVPPGGEQLHQQVQVQAQGEKIMLYATSPDRMKMTQLTGAVVSRAGKVLLPAKRVAESLRTAPEGEAELLVIDGSAQLIVGPCQWTYSLYQGPAANFPTLTDVDFDLVDGPELAAALADVRYAATKESYRPHLMQIEVSATHVTASDGARVARVAYDCPVAFTVPVSALDDVLKVLKAGKTRVGVTPTHLVFVSGASLLVVAQLSARFPDVEQQLLAPYMKNTDTLTVQRAALQDAIKRARINADPESSAIVLTLHRESGIRIEARDHFGNATREVVPATWEASERRIVIQHRLLTELLASSTDPTCTLLVGPDSSTRPSPLLMRGDDGVEGLVQSTRLDWLR